MGKRIHHLREVTVDFFHLGRIAELYFKAKGSRTQHIFYRTVQSVRS